MSKISIRSKLVRMQILLAFLVLLASLAAFSVNDLFIFKRSVERNLESLAKILSENLTPALAFADEKEAGKILATLQSEPSIFSSYLLDGSGALFAQYGKPASDTAALFERIQNQEGAFLEGSHLSFFYRIMQNNELKGYLYLNADLKVFAAEYKSYVWIVSSVFLAGVLLAFGLAHLTQRSLSRPIMAFAETAKAVSSSGNYYFRMGGDIVGDSTAEISTLAMQFNQMLDQIEAKDEKILAANTELERKVEQRTHELRETQQTALQNAHAAGMAEIATGILHNIGNIINSVNTSVEEISDITQNSKIHSLLKANEMLKANLQRAQEYLTTDPKGKLLPEFYLQVGEAIKSEYALLDQEAKSLEKKLMLIKDVIQTQQEYAKKDLFFEEASLVAVTDEILNLQMNSLSRHRIEVIKKYQEVSPVRIQRVKFAHILMNLVKNAKEAMALDTPGRKILTIEIGQQPAVGIFLKISDSGEGIDPENLKKIFNHGFTTKKSGHGFGLHFCANAMTEMGGKLVVESAGVGQGASFVLFFSNSAKDIKYA